ncbi:MAG: TetR/AcrR family transcriptional regulator, partial [Methyloceanibacter sp.]
MFDDFSKRAKVVRAALALAQQRKWGEISLADIAQTAGLSLSDLRHEFSCKSDILRAFQAEVDAEVLSKSKAIRSEQSPRDRVFDVIMTRFEVLAPYKPALKRISDYLCCHPGEGALMACSTLASQYWMLAGAGIKLDGPGAALRVAGLTAIYGKVFQIWLDDPSPSLDKTMAALDRRLSNGEQWLKR